MNCIGSLKKKENKLRERGRRRRRENKEIKWIRRTRRRIVHQSEAEGEGRTGRKGKEVGEERRGELRTAHRRGEEKRRDKHRGGIFQ